jgi:DNA-binding response OmpR family regulator
MKILVIEDDQLVADTLMELLTSQTYAVEVAPNGESGWNLITSFEYDLVVLDLMLPQLDGISLCRQVRHAGIQVPILIVTQHGSPHDKAIGLDAGADDYVVQPFDPEELLARVRALLRRSGESAQPSLTWGHLQLNPRSCQVTYSDRVLPLTPKEYALMELFLRSPKRVFSCSTILDHLWAYEEAPGEEAVRTHIKGLRQKLKAAGAANDVLETVYGIGYRLKAQEVELDSEPYGPAGKPIETGHVIQQVWQKSQERVKRQLDSIQTAVEALDTHQSAVHDLLQQAIRDAHTLAGGLGMFGLGRGSQVAKQIESLLRTDMALSYSEVQQLRTCLDTLYQEIDQAHLASEVPPLATEDDRPILLLASHDRRLIRALTAKPEFQVFHIDIARSLSRAKEQLYRHTPKVVVLDPDVAPHLVDSLTFLSHLRRQSPPVPVVILTVHTDLTERLKLARSGAHILLPKPANPDQVFEAVQQALERSEHLHSKVMVVDDDPSILTAIQHLLQPWGLRVTTLADPQQFWPTLVATQPDLLILDILMPEINGIELCQIVRSDTRWSELPILVLTAHQDGDIVNQVFSAGADDFVSKPLTGPELVTRVINRLERTQQLQHRRHGPILPSPLESVAEEVADSNLII